MKKYKYMGIDQYGNTYHDLTEPPLNALLERFGTKKSEKMYIDDRKGNSFHIGYVIQNHWITLYRVYPVRIPA